jgi:hypothetical protein
MSRNTQIDPLDLPLSALNRAFPAEHGSGNTYPRPGGGKIVRQIRQQERAPYRAKYDAPR